MHVQQMISTHPHVRDDLNHALLACIEHCFDCAQTCITCADACLAEEELDDLRQCIRLNLDCADICEATGAMASRRTGSNHLVLSQAIETCRLACEICERECRSHASNHEHCKICAVACRACKDACEAALASLSVS